MGHQFAQLFDELALFIIEYNVFEKTNVPLFRNHDDILFWHHDKKRAKLAWGVLYDTLTKIGMEPNLQHSGHIDISLHAGEKLVKKREKLRRRGISLDAIRDFETWLADEWKKQDIESGVWVDEQNLEKDLPEGSVYWHLLKVGPDGEWDINEDYLQYMQKCWQAFYNQDSSKISVLQLINFYNAHGRRIMWLLETPSPTMGRSHLDLVVKVLSDLHFNPLPDSDKNIAEIVKDVLEKNFPVESKKINDDNALVDGWMYLPIRAGGLSLENYAVKVKQIEKGFEEVDQFRYYELERMPKNYLEYLQTVWRIHNDMEEEFGHNILDLPPNWRKVDIPVYGRRMRNIVEYTDGYLNTENFMIQFERPKWRGNFDYNICTAFSNSWNNYTTLNHSYFRRWMEITKEKAVHQDNELAKMISEFCASADRSSLNIGPYFTEIIRLYGPLLKETFGGFGIIPADLVPYALVKQVGETFQPGGVEDDEDWVNVQH